MKPIMQSTLIVSILTTFLLALPALANNIRVENVDIRKKDTQQQMVDIEFDVSWENSWRNELNHDAAWVFVKFRAPASALWQHAYLSVDAAHHTVPGGVVELGASEVGGTTKAVGTFIYSANNQTGTVSYARASLRWDYGASGCDWAVGEKLDISVHAIEMVYVAEGSFFVGSGGTESGSFTDGSWESGPTIPFEITSEAALDIAPVAGSLYGTATDVGGWNTIGPDGTLPAAFPKGHAPFYCMKYSLTQGQYVEFLNLLTYAQQNSRTAGNPSNPVGTYEHNANNRLAIHIATSGVSPNTPAVYATDNPYVPCNFLIYPDGAAYAQWAGLRPMTELEFEKACRGPATPVVNEYAWGTADVYDTGGIANYSNLGAYNESVGQGNVVRQSNNPNGPARVGIFATSNATRVTAGASYWGIMELSGNLFECPVSVGHETGRLFEGTHGGGELSSGGHATQSDWPGYGSGGTVTGFGGSGYRGGNWEDGGTDRLRTSDRGNAARVLTVHNRWRNRGWRGVRSASFVTHQEEVTTMDTAWFGGGYYDGYHRQSLTDLPLPGFAGGTLMMIR